MKDQFTNLIQGEVFDDDQTLQTFSTDASIFTIKPQLVIAPKNTDDIKNLIKYCLDHPNTSLTPRAAGTCMSGGPISESIVLDMTKHFNQILEITPEYAITQPGVYYRDFDKQTLTKGVILPSYTSSRELCTVGGMVGNNAAGEKTLSYGQTDRYVEQLKVVFADGNEYLVKPLSRTELDQKIAQNDFEGNIYKQIFELIQENQELIQKAKPTTSKNSAGYYLWNVWDGTTFDLTKLLVGSQGTLGIITEIKFKLVKLKTFSATVIITLPQLNELDKIINEVLKYKPESFECFDNQTLMYAVKFLPEIIQDLKHTKFAYLKLIPEFLLRFTNQYPPLTLLAEFTGDSKEEVLNQCQTLQRALKQFNLKTKTVPTKDAEKYWVIRRQSFGLLKKHAVNMRTAPFIDDIIVRPEHLPEFLPKLNTLLETYKNKLVYTLAGHIGNGNFHIIPLVNLADEETRNLIPEISKKVFDLVFSYQGSMAAEHNDGLVRGPFLPQMYGEDIYELFRQVKFIFDPKNIFNPHKKSDATFKYYFDHIAKS